MLIARKGYRWVKRTNGNPGLEDDGWKEEKVPKGYKGPTFIDLTQGLTEEEIIEEYNKP